MRRDGLVLTEKVATDGGHLIRTDEDRDGFFEHETMERYDAQGLALQQETRFSPTTREVIYRRTLSRGPPGKMHHKEEKLVSGRLSTTAEFETDALQR